MPWLPWRSILGEKSLTNFRDCRSSLRLFSPIEKCGWVSIADSVRCANDARSKVNRIVADCKSREADSWITQSISAEPNRTAPGPDLRHPMELSSPRAERDSSENAKSEWTAKRKRRRVRRPSARTGWVSPRALRIMRIIPYSRAPSRI